MLRNVLAIIQRTKSHLQMLRLVANEDDHFPSSEKQGAGHQSAAICHSMLHTHKWHQHLSFIAKLSFNQSPVLYDFLMHDTAEHFPKGTTKATTKLTLKGKCRGKQTLKRIKIEILAQSLNKQGEVLFTICGTQAFVKHCIYSSNQLWQGKELVNGALRCHHDQQLPRSIM